VDRHFAGYVVATLALAALTAALAPLLDERHIVDVAMLYLLVTLLIAARWGYGAGIFSAIAADLLVNFFYVPPLHRFTVQGPVNLAGLAIFLAVALFGAFMLSRLREQAAHARARERETSVLLGATREIAHAETPRQALDRLSEVIARAVGARGCAILAGEPLTVVAATVDSPSGLAPTRDELAVSSEALRSGAPARLNPVPAGKRGATNRAAAVYFPLAGPQPAVLRLVGELSSEMVHSQLLQALANETSIALERLRLAREAERVLSLQRADELKSALLSSVSHDLRTPLTAIKAAASSLRDETVDWTADDRRSFLETIESQTDRLTTTVSNLLEMSRIEGGAVRPTLEAIEVAPLFEELTLAASHAGSGRQIVSCAPPGLWMKADYGLLQQALANLIENAARYSTPGEPIFLEAAPSPGRMVLSVRDTGPGIPSEDLPHLFEKFYRGRAAGPVKGTGLGLSLVKAMVELSGGTVSVESTDQGARFTLSLPSAAAPI
jgi:two-component system sensor histidine kinase KdpD